MNIELKPCPFCGGEAEFAWEYSGDAEDWHATGWVYVGCKNCYAKSKSEYDGWHNGKENAAKLWNSRAHDLLTYAN